jgi:lysyl-tRNA synthetase class 2
MTENETTTPVEEVDLPEQIEVRLAKRDRLNELNDAYPVSLPITTTIDAVRAKYPDLEVDVATGEKVGIAGRVMFQRNTGKLCFASLQAGSGQRIPVSYTHLTLPTK